MSAPSLSLVMPFYRNPGMLARHYALWRTYPAAIRDLCELIIVDDGSPEHAASVPIPDAIRHVVSIYRIKTDLAWNQHGARNLGVHVSRAPILFLTDMDHVVPTGTLGWTIAELIGTKPSGGFMFRRLDAPDNTPTVGKDGRTPKPHPNTFAMTRRTWDKVGGYDEDFCGFYGTDSMFRNRLMSKAGITMAPPNSYVVRYPREVIPDASTTTLDRDAYRRPADRAGVHARKAREGRTGVPLLLNFEWERVV